MSQAFIKLQRRGQMVIPRTLREEVGVPVGTLLKVAVVKGGQFLVTPQLTSNHAIIASPRKNRKHALQELAEVVAEIRQEAKVKGIDRIPMREIDAAVSAARRDLKNTSKQRVK